MEHVHPFVMIAPKPRCGKRGARVLPAAEHPGRRYDGNEAAIRLCGR
jgi:hypothetical protein